MKTILTSIIAICGTILLVCCSSTPNRGPITYGSIEVGRPQIFTRERHINNRLREYQFLSTQLENIKTLEASEPRGYKDIRAFAGIYNQLQAQLNPLQGEIEALNHDAAILESKINLAKFEKQLAQIQGAETINQPTRVITTDETNALQAQVKELEEKVKTLEKDSGSKKGLDPEEIKKYVLPKASEAEKTKVSFESRSLEALNDTMAFRNAVHSYMRDFQLDDTHDIRGSVLYDLKFDVTMTPGNNSQQLAKVEFEIINNTNKINNNVDILEKYPYDTYKKWVVDLINNINGEITEYQKIYYQNQMTKEQYLNLHYLISDLVPLKRLFENFKSNIPTDATPVMQSLIRDQIQDKVNNFKSFSLYSQFKSKLSSMKDEKIINNTKKTTIASFFEEDYNNYSRMIDDIVNILHTINREETLNVNNPIEEETMLKAIGYAILNKYKRFIRECDKDGSFLIPKAINAFIIDNRNYYLFPFNNDDSLLGLPYKFFNDCINKTTDEDINKALDKVRINALVEPYSEDNPPGFIDIDYELFSTYSKKVRNFLIDLLKEDEVQKIGYFKFISDLLKFENSYFFLEPYASTIEPYEYAQNISSVAAQENFSNFIFSLNAIIPQAGMLNLDNYFQQVKRTQSRLHAMQRQPLLIGYKKGQSQFGWILGPKFAIDKTQDYFLHAPVHYACNVSVVVPGWWNKLTLEPNTYWIDKSGREIKPIEKDCIQIDLIPDYTSITEALMQNQFVPIRELPYIDVPFENENKTLYLYATYPNQREQKILIDGKELWRNPQVYVGMQKAVRVEILPDMEGLYAYFDSVELPAGQDPNDVNPDPVDLIVVTSNGKAEREKAVRIIPAPKEQKEEIKAFAKLTKPYYKIDDTIKIKINKKKLPESYHKFSIELLHEKHSLKIYDTNLQNDILTATSTFNKKDFENITLPEKIIVKVKLHTSPNDTKGTDILDGERNYIILWGKETKLEAKITPSASFVKGSTENIEFLITTLEAELINDFYESHPGLKAALSNGNAKFVDLPIGTKLSIKEKNSTDVKDYIITHAEINKKWKDYDYSNKEYGVKITYPNDYEQVIKFSNSITLKEK